MSARRRLGIVVTHPIQYQVPLYRNLAANTTVEPHVFFRTDHGVAPSYDPGFGRDIHYDVPLVEGYDHEFVSNRSPRPSPSTLWGAVNPGLLQAIRRASVGALLVHGWNNPSAWLAFATASAMGIPYLLRGETRPDTPEMSRAKRLVKHAILRPLVRHAGACLAIGSENRAFYLGYGAIPERIFDALHSIDTERFNEAGERGRAHRQERLEALDLAPELPLRTELVEDAADRPWRRVLGFVNQTEIAAWYGVADLFVLPSDHEPWGLAVNEAMAAGVLPIVSDSVGCGPDLLTPEIGWVYETGNVRALANAIESAVRVSESVERRAAALMRSEQWGITSTSRGIEEALEAVTHR